ncbi:MAG: NADP-dependent malic enzyme [Nitrososphaerota archaeon]|nr:NADP-dependent malic enzyme [Nitrososphaerota archaeon]
MSETDRTSTYSALSVKYHSFYKGKVEMSLKCPVRSLDDFSVWYTPGVAEPCRMISADPDLSFEYTNRSNLIAIMSDGTRVLGLGKIGPEAALPVMEGKSLLYKYLGGVDAFPLVVNTASADDMVQTVLRLQPSFGGVNLEDIEAPKCFAVLDGLRKKASIPVWHDDQQGTATVTVAALLNALKFVGKKLSGATVALVGAGAASVATVRLLSKAGLPTAKVVMVDSKGILHPERDDVDKLQFTNPWKYELAIKTNAERRTGGIAEALSGSDVCISLSSPGPGVIKKEWVSRMAQDAVVFALANPVPEIWPQEAKEAGARVVATGRSDFPNQVNNSLVFPAVYRGTLDVRARGITDDMCLAAAKELAMHAEEKGLSETYVLPTMDQWEVYPREAAAVAVKAMEEGQSRISKSRDELVDEAYSKIKHAREQVRLLMRESFIAPLPE